MAKFCKYCGKELVDGKCDCEGFVAANAAASQPLPAEPAAEAPAEEVSAQIPVVEGQVVDAPKPAVAPQPEATVQEKAAAAAAGAGAAVAGAAAATGAAVAGAVNAVQAKTGVNFGELFGKMWNLILLGLKKPLSAVKEAEKEENQLTAMIFSGCYLLIIFFTFLIHMPVGKASKAFGIGGRASFGWWLIVLVAVAVLINSLFTWVFTKKHAADLTFKKAFAGVCMSNVYPCCAFVVAFVLGFFAPGLAELVLMASLLIWTSIMTINVQRLLQGADDDKRVWTAFVYTLVCGAIVGLVGSMVLGGLVLSFARNMTSALNYWF